MPKFDEGNRKRGIQCYLEASKEAKKETEINNLFSEEENRFSYEKAAAEIGAIGGFGKSMYMTDRHDESFNRIIDASLSKIREEVLRTAPLYNSAAKEKDMELQLDSRDYKDFLRLVKDKNNDWIDKESYELFYRNNKIRRKRILEAIFERKIKCKIIIENEEIPNNEERENDENTRIIIDGCINDLYDGEYQSVSLLLEGVSFLAWLNKEYPYEGAGEELKENDFISDTPQFQKREKNLLKIIGGLIRRSYLQKDSGKYWKGDKPNISAIAEAFQDELSKAGYSDEGFKERNLRDIITEALARIEENKNS